MFKRIISFLTACLTAAGAAGISAYAEWGQSLFDKQEFDWVVEPTIIAGELFVSDLSWGAWTDRCAVISYLGKDGSFSDNGGKYGVIGYDGRFIIEPEYDSYYNKCGNGKLNALYCSDGYSVYLDSNLDQIRSDRVSEDTIYLRSMDNSYGTPMIGGDVYDEALYDPDTGIINIANIAYEKSTYYDENEQPANVGVCGKGTVSDETAEVSYEYRCRVFENVDTSKLAVYADGKLVTDFVYEDAVCNKFRTYKDANSNIYVHENEVTAYVAAYKDKKWDIYNSDGSLIVSGADGFDGQKDSNVIIWQHGKKRACPFLPTEGYVAVKKNGKCGYYNTKGEEVIKCGTFQDVRPVHNGLAWVKTHQGLWGVIRLDSSKSIDTTVRIVKREGFQSHSPDDMYIIDYNDEFRDDNSPDKGKALVYFGRQMFTRGSNRTYSKQIAQLAAGLVAAASDPKEFFGLGETSGKGEYIVPAYRVLDINDNDISLFSYPKSEFNEKNVKGVNTGDKDFAFSIAMKDFDGTKIIMLVLRGTETSYETFHTDAAAYFHGTESFYGKQAFNTILDYKNDVIAGLKFFLDKHRDIIRGCDVKYLITGHSLGGAAANLVAAELNNTLLGVSSTNDIYAYTFGAINPLTSECDDADYSNIWNIFNYYDTFGPNGAGVPILNFKPTGGDLTAYNKFGNIVPFQFDYRTIFPNGDKTYTNHIMSGYFDAVKTDKADPGNVGSQYFRLHLKCPIDIQVIDCEGDVVTEIRNNEVVEEHTLLPAAVAEVDEGEFAKSILIPDNGSKYYVRIIGTGEGTMTLFSESFSGVIYDSYSEARITPEIESAFKDEIKIETGKELYLTVGGETGLANADEPTKEIPAEIAEAVKREQQTEAEQLDEENSAGDSISGSLSKASEDSTGSDSENGSAVHIIIVVVVIAVFIAVIVLIAVKVNSNPVKKRK